MGTGNLHDPTRCKVTVYTCCQVNVGATSDRKPERGHQCHGVPVSDGLYISHLADRDRLLGRGDRPRRVTVHII